jgi:hypothetical protein
MVVVANPIHTLPINASGIEHKEYKCLADPSNFSWFYSSATTIMPQVEQNSSLAHVHWKNKTFHFVGGSRTRQMYEQLLWEMPMIEEAATFSFDQFLFHFEQGCWKFNRSHGLDLGMLAQNLRNGLKAKVHYVIFNVATWWKSHSIGYAIDKNGVRWEVDGIDEWHVVNESSISSDPRYFLEPPVVMLMEKTIRMMLAEESPNTKLVWRSEGWTSLAET